jgi:glycosyltransferase involved in cell wall biosynthesis
LLPTKGQATAILAASLLRDKNIDFVLWIAGGVSAADKSRYSDFLRELIRRHHLERNVCLLGQRTDIPALIRLADIVVLPTHTEGLPRVILEAMALKRTVISTPVGGVTDLIEHGETGLITPVGDAEALAENMKKLLGDKRLADRIRQQAYRRVMEKFSLTNHIKLVESAFQQVL